MHGHRAADRQLGDVCRQLACELESGDASPAWTPAEAPVSRTAPPSLATITSTLHDKTRHALMIAAVEKAIDACRR